jgi:hypothetical protein
MHRGYDKSWSKDRPSIKSVTTLDKWSRCTVANDTQRISTYFIGSRHSTRFSPQVQTFRLPHWDEGSRGRIDLFSSSNRVTRIVRGGVGARHFGFRSGVNSIK